jgi:hypothetical protein
VNQKFLIVEKKQNFEVVELLQHTLAFNLGLEVKTLLIPPNGDSQTVFRSELMSSAYDMLIIGFLQGTCANFFDLASMVRTDKFCNASKDAKIFLFTGASRLEYVKANPLYQQYNIS